MVLRVKDVSRRGYSPYVGRPQPVRDEVPPNETPPFIMVPPSGSVPRRLETTRLIPPTLSDGLILLFPTAGHLK